MAELPAIPNQPTDIDAAWMTGVLRSRGVDAVIDSLAVSPIGTGQMATSVRVELGYASNPGDAPPSLVVKLSSPDPNSREAGARGAYLKEVRFYEQLQHQIDAHTPRPWFCAIDEATSAFVVVLDDLRPARQGDQIDGCTVEQAVAAARNIAGLHAPRWRDPSLFELSWLTAPAAEREAGYELARATMELLTPAFVQRYRSRMTDRHVELLDWFTRNLTSWLGLKPESFALMHGDHRLDNLMFDAANPERPVAVVDWQTLGVRNPVADVSYLLGTGLEPDVRRDSEADIVRAYHERLVELGVGHYGYDECFDDYRSECLHALLITVIGSMMTGRTDRGDDMFMAMLHRSARQIDDLDATSL